MLLRGKKQILIFSLPSRFIFQSRAQPPEDNRRKPVLGKLGTLFTSGRKRSTRNGLESPTSSSVKSVCPKDTTSSRLPESESEKSESQSSQPKQTDRSQEGSPQEADGEHSESCVQAVPSDAELSPCSSSSEAAVQQCHESDSPQLEPLQAEGDATTAAKQLHSTPGNSSRQEHAETPSRSLGVDPLPGVGGEQETASGARGVPGSPTRERSAGGLEEAPSVGTEESSLLPLDTRVQPGEGASAPPGDSPAECTENRVSSGQASATAARGDRAHPSKVLTLDIYLSKTEVSQVEEPVVITPGAEDCGDSDDMEKRSSGGRRSGRRRKSQKSTDSPGPDATLPESGARDDAVFDDEVALNAATENVSAEKKVKSPRAALDGGVASAAGSESKPSPGPKGQLRGESDRSKPPPPASSPTKRKGRSRAPEAVPSQPASGPRAPAKESPPKRAPAYDPGSVAKSSVADCGEEAARVIPRELTVKSSTLLPEIKPEHKRGPLPNHFDGRAEGGRSRELGRSSGASDADGLKPRNHFGAGRSTVTTKVTL